MSAVKQGDAAFRYTSGGQEYWHHLAHPLHRVTPAHPETVYTHTSLDMSTIRRIRIASTVEDITAIIRWDGQGDSLARFLKDARAGATLEYFPSLANPSESYDCILVSANQIQPDSDFWWDHRFATQVQLRRTDGGSFRGLVEGGTLLYYLAGNDAPGLTHSRGGSIGAYFDEDEDLQQAAANVPRIEWTDDVKAVLLEAAATNLCLQSEVLGTTWTVTRASISSNVGTAAPDGELTADAIVEDSTASNTHFLQQAFTKGASALTYTFSAFVRASTRDHIEFWAYSNNVNNRVQARWDVSTGTEELAIEEAGSGITAVGSGIESVGDSWYRCFITFTTDTDTNLVVRAMLHDGTSVTYNGDGSSQILLWGGQLEQSGAPSSYIPTTTGSVTRNADAFNWTSDAEPQAMSVFVKFIERGTAALAGAASAARGVLHWGASGASTDPRFSIFADSNGFYSVVHDNGTTAVSAALAAAPSYGDTVELLAKLNADGSVSIEQSINSAASTSASDATTATLADAWADTNVYLNTRGTATPGHIAIQEVKAKAGSKTLAEMRSL